ncbi:MAG TPA: hypothetical protein VF173_01655 [Thermoanaerobaculia bacterium]|nr:hypothetical protein [Thermoanaerobaculia bacterium]
MKKLALIAAIALVTGISTPRPSPAGVCRLCDFDGEFVCYVRFSTPCDGPDGFPECTPEQYEACLGG